MISVKYRHTSSKVILGWQGAEPGAPLPCLLAHHPLALHALNRDSHQSEHGHGATRTFTSVVASVSCFVKWEWL